MRPNVSLDMYFYWGDGGASPGSWSAVAGLRSAFGGQIEEADRTGWWNPRGDTATNLAEYKAGLRRIPRGVRTNQGTPSIDVSAVEDQMISRLSSVHWSKSIEQRLAQLSQLHFNVLKFHYSGGSLPQGVDMAALALPESRALVLRTVYGLARQALTDARKKRRKGQDIQGTMALVRRLREDARTYRRTIAPETLRGVLQRCSADDADELARVAAVALRAAQDAYEATTIVRRRRVA